MRGWRGGGGREGARCVKSWLKEPMCAGMSRVCRFSTVSSSLSLSLCVLHTRSARTHSTHTHTHTSVRMLHAVEHPSHRKVGGQPSRKKRGTPAHPHTHTHTNTHTHEHTHHTYTHTHTHIHTHTHTYTHPHTEKVDKGMGGKKERVPFSSL